MKKLMKWALIAVGALFLIGIGASLASPEGRRGLEAGQQAAMGTDEPTAATEAPTEEPTPEPTAEPTPKPTPIATPKTGLAESALFAEHVVDVAATLTDDLTALTEGANSLDYDAVGSASIDLWVHAGAERAWLEANPPHPCYADVHYTWLEAVTAYEEAGDLISDGWIYDDPTLIEQGIAAMDIGTEALGRASAAIQNLAC